MKKVREGYKMTELGEIPEEWEIYSLNEMLESNLIAGHLDGNHGGLYPKSNEFVEDGVPYIGANCIKNSRVDFANAKYLTSERAKQFKKGVAKNNDVLFAHNATVGPVALLKTELDYVILSTTLTYYRCNQEIINPVYLMYYMQTPNFVNQYSKTMGQTTRNQVPITLQRELKHIIPTKKEQDRISLILNSVDEQIEITDNLIEKTKELKKGLMQKLLIKGIGHSRFKDTEIGKIPEEWDVVKLSECGEVFGGNAFKSNYFFSDFTDNTYQVIRMGNVQQGRLKLERNPVYLDKKHVGKKEEKYVLKKSDILISLTGTVNKTDYGNVSWTNEDDKYLLNQRVACIRNKRNDFHNRFYFYFLQDSIFRNQFFEYGVGGTGNQANVSISDLNEIFVYKPSIEEQEKIAQILLSVDEKIHNYEFKKGKFQELKNGLMQKLLTGRIRVQ